MKIEKQFTINAPINRVWEVITNPELVAKCIPGCGTVEDRGNGEYQVSVQTQVGPIKTIFIINIKELERKEPEYATYETSGEEGGRASRLKAKSRLSLRATGDNETEVAVHSDLNILGRLGKFGSGMMNKIIDGMSAEFIESIARYIETGRLPSSDQNTSAAKKIAIAAGIAIVILIALILLF
jgi:carbon monoxide dehydrogenase subunit G